MSDAAEYRFLPFARRGLAARLSGTDTLPARADVTVGLTVTGAAADPVVLTLYGPGDVTGLDHRLVVRTDPVANATNVEPNYMPAIDFDLPDLPWMFTPGGPDAQGRLRPWLVLVALDAAVVDAPTVVHGQPLPTVRVAGGDVPTELPDLDDSWAWAHTQVLRAADAGPVTGADLEADAELNVSRIVCPRHLEPNRTYHACLVPAFDLGVQRGLTGEMPAGTDIGPAWTAASGDVTLPVYHHWTFATGPAGDFESLARKLRPFECPDTVGVASMYVGAAGHGLPRRDATEDGGTLEMDGALRSVQRSTGVLGDVAGDLRSGLRAAVNAPAVLAAELPDDADPIGPPVYAGWHMRRQTVPSSNARLLRELNLDPRRRAAAGIGTTIVRANQEDMVHAAWQQVGDVLEANRLLALAKLMEQVLASLHARYLQPLPLDRLVLIAAPTLWRLPFEESTVLSELVMTSLPMAAVDAAMRRHLAPGGKLTTTALEVAGVGPGDALPGFQSPLVDQLANGEVTIDPNLGFVPDGVGGIGGIEGATTTPDGRIDLAPLGMPVVLPRELTAAALEATGSTVPGAMMRDLEVRADLATTGLVTEDHVVELQRGPATALDGGIGAAVARLRDGVRANPEATAFLYTGERAAGFTALSVDAADVIHLGEGGQRRVVATVDEEVLRLVGASAITDIVASLDPSLLAGVIAVDEEPTPPRLTLDGDAVVAVLAAREAIPARPTDGQVLGRIRDGGVVLDRPGGGVVPPGLSGRVSDRLRERFGGGLPPGLERRGGRFRFPPGRGGRPRPGDETDRPGRDTPAEPARPAQPERELELPRIDANTIAAPLREQATITRFHDAVGDLGTRLRIPVATPTDAEATVVPFDLAAVRQVVIERSDPHLVVPARTATRIRQAGSALVAQLGELLAHDRYDLRPTNDWVWASPTLPTPLYERLAAHDRDRFLPGVEVIPQNAVTLVETNPAFIESFLVGANQEFNSELLWRGFPSDRRGTSLRHFWDWTDGGPDIAMIHSWPFHAGLGSLSRVSLDQDMDALDAASTAPSGGNIVLLVRGELLRRYPDASIYAWRADGEDLKEDPGPDDVVVPEFGGRFDPDFTFAGFPMTQEELEAGDGWFFLIAEQPTEPRFGMDTTGTGSPASWADLSWSGAGVAPGRHLSLADTPLAGRAVPLHVDDLTDEDEEASEIVATLATNAAHLAAITLQKPFRVAVHSRHLLLDV